MMMDDMDWYGPNAATFGDRVAAAREYAGLTQGELAKRLGVRMATLRGWEDDRTEPRANRLSMLAGLLNVSITWLISGEGEGIGAPGDVVSSDIGSILAEMRVLRTDMLAKAQAMGRLEKQLRRLTATSADA